MRRVIRRGMRRGMRQRMRRGMQRGLQRKMGAPGLARLAGGRGALDNARLGRELAARPLALHYLEMPSPAIPPRVNLRPTFSCPPPPHNPSSLPPFLPPTPLFPFSVSLPFIRFSRQLLATHRRTGCIWFLPTVCFLHRPSPAAPYSHIPVYSTTRRGTQLQTHK